MVFSDLVNHQEKYGLLILFGIFKCQTNSNMQCEGED